MFELEWSSGYRERFTTEEEAYERFINSSAWDGGSLFPVRIYKIRKKNIKTSQTTKRMRK